MIVLLALALATSLAASGSAPAGKPHVSRGEEIHVPPPPLSDGIFPCSECHADMEVDQEPRQLEDMHDDIVLDHGPKWCFDCHNPGDRDHLRMAGGDLVGFDESWKICGQCHGPKLRDWKAGVHGKRTGFWDGEKQYLLCAHCHDPHSPRFKPIKPEPPPTRPSDIR